jgi:hypothetical protein
VIGNNSVVDCPPSGNEANGVMVEGMEVMVVEEEVDFNVVVATELEFV